MSPARAETRPPAATATTPTQRPRTRPWRGAATMASRVGAAAAIAVVVVIGVAGVSPATASGDDAADGISVSPVQIERDLDSRSLRATVRVRNEGREATTVRVRTAGLGHDLDGIPQFPADDAHAEAVTVQPSRLELGGGERAAVTVRGQLPDDGLYAAVLVEADPPPAPEAQIAARTQVATLVMARGPRPWDERIAIEAVALRERAEGGATLAVHVDNRGKVHAQPHGHAVVTGAGGRELARVELPDERVLPGYARRLSAPVELPAGAEGPFTVHTVLTDSEIEERHTVELEPAVAEAEPNTATDGEITRADGAAGPTRVEGAADGTPTPVLAVAVVLLVAVSLALAWVGSRQQERRRVAA